MPVRDSAKITPEARAVAAARERAEEAARARAEVKETEAVETEEAAREVTEAEAAVAKARERAEERARTATAEAAPEVKAPAVPELGKPMVVRKAGGDKFVVRTWQPDGTYLQQLMTAEEVLEKGGVVAKQQKVYDPKQKAFVDPGDRITASGIKTKYWGDYLRALIKAGYRGEGRLTPEQQRILQSFQSRTQAELKAEAKTKAGVALPVPLTREQIAAAVSRTIAEEAAITRDIRRAETFEANHIRLPDGKWVKIEDWNKLPAKYQSIGLRQGYDAMVKAYQEDLEKFRSEHILLADDKWVKIEDWNKLPGKYQTIGLRRGFDAMTKAFESDHIQLPDGKWIEVKQWNKILGKYQSIGLRKGFNAMVQAIEADRRKQEQAIAKMERYKTEHGYDLLTAIRFESPDTLRDAGFAEKDIRQAKNALETSRRIGVALPGERNWYNVKTGEIVSDDVFRTIVKSNPAARDDYVRAPADVRRMAIQGISTMFFSPVRVALPEVKLKDIKPAEYAVGAGQLALWAIPFLPKGAAIPLMAGAGSTLGYNYAKNYRQLDTKQKVLGASALALVSLPALAAGIRALVPTAVSIPTKSGMITVWKGISMAGKPVVGISQKRLAVGTKGVSLPEFATIQKGYIPVTKLETSLTATRNALRKMGATEADITKVEETLRIRNFIAGKKSPYLSEQAILQGSERLTPEEVATILRHAVKNAGKIESVYGSSTIPPQLRPNLLKLWRKWHDVDIQTTMTPEELGKFTAQVAKDLRKAGAKVKIDPTKPGTILKSIEGKWEKITDFHSKEKVPGSPDTLEGAYGMLHAEPVVRIKLPGVGEFSIMRLSETGKRKIASVLEFQEGKIAPPPHRVNDIADLYIIIRNFKGKDVADRWAKAWGIDPEELIRIYQTSPPSQLLGWKLIPSDTGKGSPVVSITPPASMMAKLSPTVRASLAATLAKPTPLASPSVAMASPLISVSPIRYSSPSLPVSAQSIGQVIRMSSPALPSKTVSKIASSLASVVSPMVSAKASSKSISATVSKVLSPYVSKGVISPSVAASISASISKAASLTPSPYPSLSPSPSPVLSPVPSLTPSPSPSPSPIPEPVPTKLLPPIQLGRARPPKHIDSRIAPALIVWRQGMLKQQDGKLRPVWKVLDVAKGEVKTVFSKPKGAYEVTGPMSAYRTAQRIGRGLLPRKVLVDMGVVDIEIHREPRPSGKGTRIRYKAKGKGLKTDISGTGKTFTGVSIVR